MIKVFCHTQQDGQSYHRMEVPFNNIHKPLESKGIKLSLQTGLNNISEFDAFVLSRCPHQDFMDDLKMCKRMKKKIIWEIDDDIYNLPTWNPAHKQFDAGALDRCNWMRDNADHIIASTHYLKKIIDRPNTIVLPNLLDTSLWNHPRYVHKGLRIVFQGSAFHQEDLMMIAPIVEEIIKIPDVMVIFFGDMPENMIQWVRIWGQPFAEMAPKDVYNGKVGFVRPVIIQDFPKTLCAISPDIGICPLVDEQFAYSKSNLKYLEYTMAGAVTLAQDLPPYNHNKCWLTKDWLKDLTTLCTHPNLTGLKEVARKEVIDNYTWQKQKHIWISAFEKMLL